MAPTIVLQIQPAIMFMTGIGVVALLTWIVWPKNGLLAQMSRIKLNSHRVQLEDALKFLFDCEYKSRKCDLNSLAGNLSISSDQAGRLLEKLLAMGLVNMDDHNITLTDTGRAYSLRVIRVHRIWERYLADETGVAPGEWHKVADRMEHHLSAEETDKLAAQMGNPVFDPHGDPIPTAEGVLPELKGQPLSFLKEGDIGRITHIEDEPRSIYEQLLVLGLFPGMQVYVTDVSENKITFAGDGDECTLTPLFASQITVELQKGKTPVTEKYNLLSDLDIGEEAEIIGISPNCRGQQRRRLMDLGIVPGSKVTAEIKSASGDPVGYRILGTTIGIRRQQAGLIFINRKNKLNHE